MVHADCQINDGTDNRAQIDRIASELSVKARLMAHPQSIDAPEVTVLHNRLQPLLHDCLSRSDPHATDARHPHYPWTAREDRPQLSRPRRSKPAGLRLTSRRGPSPGSSRRVKPGRLSALTGPTWDHGPSPYGILQVQLIHPAAIWKRIAKSLPV